MVPSVFFIFSQTPILAYIHHSSRVKRPKFGWGLKSVFEEF